jgi:glycosyltransferase involved in cell wall biosynthesis
MKFINALPLKGSPSVSVVVPCYNYGRYLPELIAGVLDQPGLDVDILIVDDASPDGSGEVGERLAADNQRVNVLRHRSNKGHILTYNDGLSAVTGDYVVLLSADDMLPPGALTRAVALMQEYPSVGFVYGFARSFTGDAPVTPARVRNWTVWPGEQWLRISTRRARCFISSPEVVMRRAALESVGYYDPRLPHSGDLDMWLRTALNWDVGRVNGSVQALYRVHDSNMHLTTFAGMLTDLRERRLTFDMLFDEHAVDRPDVRRIRPQTRRALARESLRLALAGRRDGVTDDTIAEYVHYALETDPTVTRDPWWTAWSTSSRVGGRLPAVRARQFAAKTVRHIAWRRERRYGL